MSQHTDTHKICDSMDQIITETILLVLVDSTMPSIPLDANSFCIFAGHGQSSECRWFTVMWRIQY